MMSFRRLTLGACLCFMLGTLSAQQLSLFTQYRENATILNPAAMESDFLAQGQNITLGANYRSQWSEITGNPTTQAVRFSWLGDNPGASLLAGGYLMNDQTGPTGFTGLYARVGAVISGDPEYSGLAIALSGGLVQYRVNANEISLRDPNDVLGMNSQTELFPDVGAGIYFYQTLSGPMNGDMFYAGVSVPQVAGIDLTFKTTDGEFAVQRVQHFYGMLGLYHFLRNDGYLEPSLWIKYVDGAPLNADLNLRYQTPTSLWIGTGISTAGNFHFEAGFNLGDNVGLYNNVKVGYGYDYSFSSFGPSVGNTHELQVSYSIDR